MKTTCCLLIVVLWTSHAFAQQAGSIGASAQQAAVATAAETNQTASAGRHNKLFWPGVAVGTTGVALATLALTSLRVENRSAGNSPDEWYRECVARAASNPVYATSDCNALKGANVKLMWSGAALGAVGAALIIGGLDTHAQVAPGGVRVTHRIRF